MTSVPKKEKIRKRLVLTFGAWVYALLYEPTDGNNPSKPHKIGPFFLM